MVRKKTETKISNAVIKRLPRYRRYLLELIKKDVDKISSKELSEMMGYTASQIRQDLNNFGDFGQQGYGYNVESLYKQISAILGLDQEYTMVIVGSGNMGTAIANYTHYNKVGFKVIGLFDACRDVIGKQIGELVVRDTAELVRFIEVNKVDIGIICTPYGVAQEIADRMCFAGVRGIWNFATVDIEVPDSVALENVYISDSLHSLAYHMNLKKDSEEQ